MDSLISEQASSEGLSNEDRTKQTTEVAETLLATKRIICTLIEHARAEWLPADYTDELNPLAILSVVQVEAPAVQPGSSLGMSGLLKR